MRDARSAYKVLYHAARHYPIGSCLPSIISNICTDARGMLQTLCTAPVTHLAHRPDPNQIIHTKLIDSRPRLSKPKTKKPRLRPACCACSTWCWSDTIKDHHDALMEHASFFAPFMWLCGEANLPATPGYKKARSHL